MADPKRVLARQLPPPTAQYDRGNEAAFRSELQRQLSEFGEAVRELGETYATSSTTDGLTATTDGLSSTVASLVSGLAALAATVSALVATITPTFASIYVHEGSTAQTGISTTTKLTCFSSDGANGESGGNATPDKANNKITVSQDGKYEVTANISFSGSAATGYHFHVNVDDVDTGEVASDRDIGTPNTVGSTGMNGILNLTSGQEVSIYVTPDSTASITVISAGLSLKRLGPTLTGPVA